METHDLIAPRTLGEALRLLQRRATLTRDQFAVRAGVSSGAMSNYLNDLYEPSPRVLRRMAASLAERLSVDAEALYAELEWVARASNPTGRPGRPRPGQRRAERPRAVRGPDSLE